MPHDDHRSRPDQHLDPAVAARYDAGVAEQFSDDVIRPTVELLADLAGDGRVVEFAVGTGRIALPLSAAGVEVLGIDVSQPMLDQLRAKPGADRIELATGDMTETRVCDDAAVVFLVFNSIGNLRTQRGQADCFRNAAAHLRTGGRFVIENVVPSLRRLPPGETIVPFDVSSEHVGFDEYVDFVDQIHVSHHYYISGDRVLVLEGAFRYVWPSELDLMATLAGMELEARYAGWRREPFTAESTSHVSIWRKR